MRFTVVQVVPVELAVAGGFTAVPSLVDIFGDLDGLVGKLTRLAIALVFEGVTLQGGGMTQPPPRHTCIPALNLFSKLIIFSTKGFLIL